ncbi:MAG: sigma-54-dependent transcriptional regulator, partial [Bradymonadaceae bacterium]
MPTESNDTGQQPATHDDRGHVLIVDDERKARQTMSVLLDEDGFETRTASNGYKALGVLDDWSCEVVLTDLRMPMLDGFELIEKVHENYPDIACIAVTAFDSVESAVDAMKSGAEDYLPKPLDFDAVELVVDRAVQRVRDRSELARLRESAPDDGPEMIGDSPPMQTLKDTVDQIATSNATVLITGESGTGKELVARRVHDNSDRADGPFVQLHCSALSQSLLESELFGHEKGAFTG